MTSHFTNNSDVLEQYIQRIIDKNVLVKYITIEISVSSQIGSITMSVTKPSRKKHLVKKEPALKTTTVSKQNEYFQNH